MAVIGTSYLNLLDTLRATPNGKVLEVLSQTSPLMDDAWIAECNKGDYHEHAIRTGLPAVTWGALYRGIPQSKGHTSIVKDTTGFVETLTSIDERLLAIKPEQTAQLRLNEISGSMEAMSQEWTTGFFYHDTATAPEKFKGMAARYNSLSNPNVINGGGVSSDNTSIWIVSWGDNYTSLIHPEGTPGGITREDKGKQRVLDAAGNPFWVEEELVRLYTGVSVGDWRYNTRIANIDVSNVQAGTVDLYALLRSAFYRLQSRRVARPGSNIANAGPAPRQAIYMNRDMLQALEAIAQNKGSTDNFVRLTRTELDGAEVMSYRGIPIRETDALINAETLVS